MWDLNFTVVVFMLDPETNDKIIDIENEDKSGIGYFPAHPVSVSANGHATSTRATTT